VPGNRGLPFAKYTIIIIKLRIHDAGCQWRDGFKHLCPHDGAPADANKKESYVPATFSALVSRKALTRENEWFGFVTLTM